MPHPPAQVALTVGDAGPRAAFLHANGFPPLAYRALLERLAGRLTVQAWATRPLLRPEPEPIGWDQLAHDVLDEDDGAPCVAIGHSMGATAFALAAAARPERFRALVMIEPAMVRPWQAWALRWAPPALAHRLGPAGPTLRKRDRWPDEEAFRASCRRSGIYEGLSERAFDDFVAAALRATSEGVALAFPKAWEAHFFTCPPAPGWALAKVTCPVVAIRGESSVFLDDARWTHLLARAADPWTRALDGLGHLAPLEAPDRVADAVLEGLEAHGVLG